MEEQHNKSQELRTTSCLISPRPIITSKNSPLTRLRSLVPRSPSRRLHEHSVMSVSISLSLPKEHGPCKYATPNSSAILSTSATKSQRQPIASARKLSSNINPVPAKKPEPKQNVKTAGPKPKIKALDNGRTRRGSARNLTKSKLVAMFAAREERMMKKQKEIAELVEKKGGRLEDIARTVAKLKQAVNAVLTLKATVIANAIAKEGSGSKQ